MIFFQILQHTFASSSSPTHAYRIPNIYSYNSARIRYITRFLRCILIHICISCVRKINKKLQYRRTSQSAQCSVARSVIHNVFKLKFLPRAKMLIFWSAIIHQLPHTDLQISLIRYSEKQLLILHKRRAITNVVLLLRLVYLHSTCTLHRLRSTYRTKYLVPIYVYLHGNEEKRKKSPYRITIYYHSMRSCVNDITSRLLDEFIYSLSHAHFSSIFPQWMNEAKK